MSDDLIDALEEYLARGGQSCKDMRIEDGVTYQELADCIERDLDSANRRLLEKWKHLLSGEASFEL